MAFPQPRHLNEEQIEEILSVLPSGGMLSVTFVHYKNQQEISTVQEMTTESFIELVRESLESGWGKDLELHIPSFNQKLVGHHDGVFWLE
jgi:hypothetical protein